jgi:hypothetical protein
VRYGGFVVTACRLSKQVLFPEKRSPAGQPILSVEARGYPSPVRVSRQSQRLVVLVAEEGFGMGVAKDFRLACGNPI